MIEMTPFEQGYNRTMKVAGILDRLRRAPQSLMDLPGTQSRLRSSEDLLGSFQRRAQKSVRDWKGDPDYTLTPEDTEKLTKAFQQATTNNVPGDPRLEVLKRLERVPWQQKDVDAIRRLRNEQLKDVGVGGAAVAAPLAGAGLVMSQED